ncbi:glycosyltransferase family 4 protein [Balneolaceae bacterium YR4-1]|uniref:Glycosyltransferase family 4 protein n=1 Tax=Halalkalibaculum roseum TaxID=2709311 RepID=A0A6M1SRV2_9BACT|nr:glycosyltransferase [Halalkalibaculum roseum]NGP78151.1 glycosyltransferase family 4 protein [Halalkalibaculum roseum]
MDGDLKKKILIVSASFYPDKSPRSIRTTELVREFARLGHEVHLLTKKNDEIHVSFEKKYGVTIINFGPLKFPRIKLHDDDRFFLHYLKRVLRRGLNLFFEYPEIELMYRVKRALKSATGYDLIISIAVPYPIHWGVAWSRDENNLIAKTWVADCGDPYFGHENDSFKVPFYFSFIEKWFCRKTDYLSIPFEGAKAAYFKEFHHKIRIIPQGLSFPVKTDNNSYVKNNVITFAYFGNIESYQHYALPFLEKLNSIRQSFRFIVYTRREDFFKSNLDDRTLKKCTLRDYVDRDVLLDKLQCVDFLVHFPYKKGTQKSLKLVDYSFLGKPILEYKNDPYSEQALMEFLNFNFEKRREFEDYTSFDINNVCKQFLELIHA